MQKIRFMQNAATFVSDLTVQEFETLQRQCPMALAITEPNMEGGEDIVFSATYNKNTAFGIINDEEIMFVDNDAEGRACLTVLIPANAPDKATFCFNRFATPVNFLKTVERNAKKALANLITSKEAFAEQFINLDAETTVSEALEEVDVIVKAEKAPKKGGKA